MSGNFKIVLLYFIFLNFKSLNYGIGTIQIKK